jgi:nucleoside-diphosphate-sugar epimerase
MGCSKLRVLVTGGSGYVGSVLLPKLSNRHDVTALDIQPPLTSVRWIEKDMASLEPHFLEDYDAIIHLAGIVGDSACDKSPAKAIEMNYLATRNILKQIKGLNKKIIFASTCAVYAVTKCEVNKEDTDPAPLTLYGLTKLASERDVFDSGGVILRFGTLHGKSPRPRFDLVVNRFVRDAVKGKIVVHGGDQIRPFIHVSDAADALFSALTGQPGIYNVSSENMTVLSLAYRISDKIPCKVEVNRQMTDRLSYAVDSSRTQESFGLKFQKRIEDTIAELRNEVSIAGSKQETGSTFEEERDAS